MGFLLFNGFFVSDFARILEKILKKTTSIKP